jgi:MFS family permease
MTLQCIRNSAVDYLSRRCFYGWPMVAIAALAIFASGPGQSHTFSVFVPHLAAELNITNATIATAYGLATFVAAFALPRMGRLIDRYGTRSLMGSVAVILGAACLMCAAVGGPFMLAIAFAALRFFGQGSLMMCAANLVAQWFRGKRGFAMGLTALGFAASMAVHPPLGHWLADQFGWRNAWLILGVLTWIILIPPVLFLVWNKPEDLGMAPDGISVEPGGVAAELQLDGLSLAEALRTTAFYIVTIGWAFIAMLVTALHFHQIAITTQQGVGADVASRLFPISALAMVVAMPLVGRVFDQVKTRYVFAAGLLVTALSLLLASAAHDVGTATAYAICFGVNNALSMTMFGYLMPRFFGRRHIGHLQGTGQLIGVVGASIGPLPIGMAFDLVGSGGTTLQLLAIAPLLWAVAALFLRTPDGVLYPRHLE